MIELLPTALIILYFVPFMVAAGRNHDSTVAVLVANLLLGWTVIGWIVVFAWALFSPAGTAPPPVLCRGEGAFGLPEARRVKDPARAIALPRS